MKSCSQFFLLFAILIILSCQKTETTPKGPVHCDGLINQNFGIQDDALLLVPNAFTPNEDGLNDAFGPVTRNVASYVMTIYDEQNQVVFTSDNHSLVWASHSTTTLNKKYLYKIQAITKESNYIGVCGEVYPLSCIPKGVPNDSLKFADQIDLDKGFVFPTQEKLTTCD